MQPTTQDKQRFLRQQILQSNYDPQEFISFLCKDLHIEELDAELIDMKTLESVVMKFKQYKYYQQPKKSKKAKIQYEKNVFDYEYEGRWKCIHAESLMDKLQVFVPNYEVKQTEGLFFSIGSRTEVWFSIHSNITKQSVKRLQYDFQWLSDTIAKLYPLIAIPDLIQTSKQSDNTDQKRRKQLEEYLQILAKRKQLRISNLLYDFLTMPAERMQKLKKNWDSMGFAKGMQSIKNEQGFVNVAFTNKLRTFAQNSFEFTRKSQQYHQNISISIEKVNAFYAAASKQIDIIVQLYAELHDNYNELINSSPEQKINEYNQILVNLNNLFHLLSQNQKASANVFTTHLKEFHKIEINYDKNITKLYRNVNETQKEYVYFKSNLNRKKERIYPDVNKWEVEEKLLENRRLTKEDAFEMMLPRQTAQQQEMKNWMAYLYCNYKEQFQKFIGFEVNRYVNVFCTLCSELLLNNRLYVQQITKFIEESQKLYIK